MSNNVIFVFKAIDKKVIETSRKIAKGIGKITEKTKTLNRVMAKASTGFRKFGAGINSNIGNLVAGVGLFATLQKAVGIGAQFQDSIADLEAITGLTGEKLEFLKGQTLELAKASAFSQDKVAGAFKIIASAKDELLEDPEGLTKVGKQVLMLANTGLDLETAANVTVQALNQFGASADEAGRFVNVLAAGAQIGASEVNETGVAILKAGAIAKNVGVSFEGMNAAIQVLAKGGIKAEIAGTGLKTALLKLEAAGVKNLQPSVVGLGNALSNLNDMGLSTTQMSKLFGLEAVTVGTVLAENADLVKTWTKTVSGSNEAQRQAAIRTRTFNANMRRVGITLATKVVRVFELMEPVITRSAEQFGAWLDNVDSEQVEAFADSLKLVLNAAIMIGKAFGKVLSVLESVGEIIGEIAAAISTLDFSQFTAFEKASRKLDKSFLGGANTPGAFIMNMFGADPQNATPPVEAFGAPVSPVQKTQTDITLGIKAPPNTVEKVSSVTTGKASGLNVGVNMVRD